MNKNKCLLIFILVVGFLLRLLPLSFPLFTSDEARIAVRGYTLAEFGTDELGRKYPYIFNSSEDYQLPLVSYITTLGILIFGKTDLGARIPFILIGTLLIFFVYKLSELNFGGKKLNIYAAIIACFSPGLIFFSKFPNEFIISAFLLILLLISLRSEKINIVATILIICLMLLTTKIFWFSLIPITVFSLYINKNMKRQDKIFLSLFSLTLNLLVFFLFIRIPQGVRSLIENNFSTINDLSIKNGIERLRSQTLPFWSMFLDRILFSKVHFLVGAFFNWLSHFQPSILFGQLDKNGGYGFLDSGVFPKATIIPFFAGIFKIIQGQRGKSLYLLIFILLLSFPLLFIYPNFKVGYIIAAGPFIVLIITFGFEKLNSKISYLILFLAVFEIFINYLFISSSVKNSSNLRPSWIKEVVKDIYNISLNNKVYVSDNSISGLLPFIEWYTPIEIKPDYKDIVFPYKFYEGEILNIKTIGESNRFVECRSEGILNIFVTHRDKDKLSAIDKIIFINSYKDDSDREILDLVQTKKCIR